MSKLEVVTNAIGSMFSAVSSFLGKSKERQDVRRENHQIKAVEYADTVFRDFDIKWVNNLIREADPTDEAWNNWLKMRKLFEHSKDKFLAHRKRL